MTTTESKPGWEQVFNADGERSRGLWKRGDRFYVQCTTIDPATGLSAVKRILLPTAKTEAQARKEAAPIRAKAANGEIFNQRGAPSLAVYIPHYLANCHKAEHTVQNEKIYLNRWLEWLGDVRLSNITPAQILSYRTEYRKTLSAHSVNLQVNALKSLLKLAKQEGKIEALPTEGIVQLKHRAKKKDLLSPEEIEKIIAAAETHCPKSGKQYADYVKLACGSGGREEELLSLQWEHILFEKRLIHFKDNTKFDKPRFVNFNPRLETHLKDMASRKTDSPWLFPSPRTDGPITDFKKTQEKIEEKTGLDYSDHSFRHYFASMCVMQGIDFMSIAKWLGHADGGVLVGKVYGHLNNAHLIAAANRLTF
jgi:integrase